LKALFDTNILIDYLKGIEPAQVELDRHRQRLISRVTWIEVHGGVRNDDEADVAEMFLRDFEVIELTRAIAREAAEIRRTIRIRLPDAVIWATARHESALLVTRNTKDFPAEEPGIRIPYRISSFSSTSRSGSR
jgi:predicted nucleic acid-binding protein